MEFSPVCCNGNQFTNICRAKCKDYEEADCSENACGSCICPLYYEPVCFEGNVYGNACKAACDSFDVSTQCTLGECETTTVSPDCLCTREYNPVCCEDVTYSNLCLAECDDYMETDCSSKACDDDSCLCSSLYSPVCCDDVQYGNKCNAMCAGVDTATCSDGECESQSTTDAGCYCAQIYDPVCCDNTNQFGNGCMAGCAGYDNCEKGVCDETKTTEDDSRTTDEPCIRTSVYDPWCCSDDDGESATYSNACVAGCSGFNATAECVNEECFDKSKGYSVYFIGQYVVFMVALFQILSM